MLDLGELPDDIYGGTILNNECCDIPCFILSSNIETFNVWIEAFGVPLYLSVNLAHAICSNFALSQISGTLVDIVGDQFKESHSC